MTDSEFCISLFTPFLFNVYDLTMMQMIMMMMTHAYYKCILHTHDDNDDKVTYFGGHNATFIDGLRPTLEAPSTSWSE
jgi:hypothetical protein